MSAPTDTAQKCLAAGALIAVAVGVSFASSCFKEHLKSTLPEPAMPAPYPPAIVTPPPAPLGEVDDEDPDDDATAASDPRTNPVGTAKSSLAAVPSWARSTSATPYAPVHSRAAELFALGAKPQGDVSRAVVVCGGGRPQYEADLHLRATVGTMPEVSTAGARGAKTVHLSTPLVDLKEGVPIKAVLSQRTSEDSLSEVARMEVTAGEQLRSWQKDEIDCVALSGDELLDRIAEDLGRADSAVVRLWRLPVRPRQPWGTEETSERSRVERRISDVAALAGWDDPRVKTRVANYAAAMKRLDAERQRTFDEQQISARRDTTVDGLFVVFEELACSAETCEIALRLQNDERSPRTWAFPDVKITFLTAGKERPQAFTDAETPEVVLAPNEWKKVLVRGPQGLKRGKTLAQVCLARSNDMACGMIALR